MFTIRIRLLLVAMLTLLNTGPSFAANCGSGKILLQDKFKSLSAVWGITPGPDLTTGPGGLAINLKAGISFLGLNQSGFFGDYEVCMTVKTNFKCTDPAQCEASPYVGITFWGADRLNFYACDVTPAYSTVAVWRTQNNKNLNPVPAAILPKDTLPKLSQKDFDISVSVTGNHLICKVNGVVAAEIDGLPPEGGSLFGFDLGSATTNKDNSKVIIKNIEIRELQAQ